MANEVATIASSFQVAGQGSDEMRTLAQTASEHLKTGFGGIKNKMDELEAWKKNYDKRSGLGKWWDNNILAEKRDEMILVTMESARQQMDVVKFIAWLNVQMLALQKDLNESQNQIKEQNAQLQKQQGVITEQQAALERQQKRVEEENKKILEGCEVLRSLRKIVVGHEQNIGTNKSGIDQLLIQLKEIYTDIEQFDRQSKSRDDDLAKKFAVVEASQKELVSNAEKLSNELRETANHVIKEIADNAEKVRTGFVKHSRDLLDKAETDNEACLNDFKKTAAEISRTYEGRVAAIEEKQTKSEKWSRIAIFLIAGSVIFAVISFALSVVAFMNC